MDSTSITAPTGQEQTPDSELTYNASFATEQLKAIGNIKLRGDQARDRDSHVSLAAMYVGHLDQELIGERTGRRDDRVVAEVRRFFERFTGLELEIEHYHRVTSDDGLSVAIDIPGDRLHVSSATSGFTPRYVPFSGTTGEIGPDSVLILGTLLGIGPTKANTPRRLHDNLFEAEAPCIRCGRNHHNPLDSALGLRSFRCLALNPRGLDLGLPSLADLLLSRQSPTGDGSSSIADNLQEDLDLTEE